MTSTKLQALSEFALRRLLAYLDERLSTVQSDPALYKKVEREYRATEAEAKRRGLL